MLMTGMFRLVLLPGIEPAAFENHMGDVFSRSVFRPTRITASFEHQLLRSTIRRSNDPAPHSPHPAIQYLWQVQVQLVTEAGYDFEANAKTVQQEVAQFALLVDIHSFSLVEGLTPGKANEED